jgi:hypothetical protein
MKLAHPSETHFEAAGTAWVEPPAMDPVLQSRALDIANRLRFVCGHLEPDEMIELALRIAAVEIKYANGTMDLERRRRSA